MQTISKIVSHYSLTKSIVRSEKLVEKAKELGITTLILADINSLSGSIDFIREVERASLKWVIGCTLQVMYGEEDAGTITFLAKNKLGWQSLLRMVSHANGAKRYKDRPTIQTEDLLTFSDENLIVLVGGYNSILTNYWLSPEARFAKSEIEAKAHLKTKLKEKDATWTEIGLTILNDLKVQYPHIYLEVQKESLPINSLINKANRWFSKKADIPCIPSNPVHYLVEDDWFDHHLMLCSGLKIKKSQLREIKDVENYPFICGPNFFLDTSDQGYSKEELKNLKQMVEQCETYKVFSNPRLPKFPTPDGSSEPDYLRQLCRDGWKKKIEGKIPQEKIKVYADRVKEELDIVNDIDQMLGEPLISRYFLITQDYVNAARNRGELVNYGRGCLSSDNKIYLKQGKIKNINQVEIGDNVLCRDGYYRPVTNTFKYDVDEELLSINCWYSDYTDLTLTKDHKVLCKKSIRPTKYDSWSKSTQKSRGRIAGYSKLEFIEAEKLEQDDFIFFPKPKFQSYSSKDIDLSVFCKDNKELRYDNDYVYHDVWNVDANMIVKTKKINRYLPLNNKFYYILGIFVGDGWVTKDKKRDDVGFAFNSKDTNRINFVKRYFEKMGCHVSSYKHKKTNLIQLIIRDRFINRLFRKLHKNYKSKANTKHVPHLIFGANDNKIKKYLLGYMSADGSLDYKANRIVYTTVSKILAYQIKLLLARINCPASIEYHIRHDTREEYKNTQPNFTIKTPIQISNRNIHYIIKKSGILYRIKSIMKINATEVYDLEVNEEHNYTTTNGCVHNSAAGSIIANLTNITDVDPIKYDLLFSRFFNKGRITKEKFSLPDCDIDFQVGKREDTIAYIKEKYGKDLVAQVVTFGALHGKGALKEVLRLNDACPQGEIQDICNIIPDPAKISGELQEMKDEEGESYSIVWALRNLSHKLQKWCYLDKDNNLQGPLARLFEQAIRLEGTLKTQSSHASAVVVAPESLSNLCPMLHSKSKEDQICGFEFEFLESMGLLKCDILGVAELDKLNETKRLIKERLCLKQ